MREPTIFLTHVGDGRMEAVRMTEAVADAVREAGRYYGYPRCCVEAHILATWRWLCTGKTAIVVTPPASHSTTRCRRPGSGHATR